MVHHAPSNRQATFGALAAKASGLPVPNDVPLKAPKDFKLIGQKLPRVDFPGKTNGTAQFTIDVTFPGMLVALLQRPPLFGATVKSFDADSDQGRARRGRGGAGAARRRSCRQEFLGGKTRPRGAQGRMGRQQSGKAKHRRDHCRVPDAAGQPGTPARIDGDVAAALKGAAKTVSATYEFPYLAHAPMEPLDAVVKLDANSCEIWAGDQFQTVDQATRRRPRGSSRSRSKSIRCSPAAASAGAPT